ncbi:MAG TPA: glycosyltransferase family 39 protein [Candidatus Paceibacterota bacterium]|nr:glycosyltransferase family 39 protein [Candidatus Paceibacterota bacterium]
MEEKEQNKKDSEDKKINQKKDRIKKWLTDPYNLTFLGILIFSLVIRLYYFSLTNNQPLWWDEAEYMSMAKAWAFGYEYEFIPVRPILFSLISALFFKISNSEFLPRLFTILISVVAIAGMYYLGKEMYDKKVGLIAAVLFSLFYPNFFYAFRLLVDIPSLTFLIFSALFFYKYVKTHSSKFLYIMAVMLGIGTLFRISTALFLFAAFIFLVITDKFRFLKRKETWIASIIFFIILAPYLIWGYVQFHGFVITQAGAWNAPSDPLGVLFPNLKFYIMTALAKAISWPLLIVFLIGIFAMYKLILGFDLLIKDKEPELKKQLYLLLLILIPIIISSFTITTPEDRYIITIFPAVFIISGVIIARAHKMIEKKNKLIALLLVLVLLIGILFLHYQNSISLIQTRKDSYLQVKQASLWIKEHSDKNAKVFTISWPQNIYYSERKTYVPSNDKLEFEQQLKEIKPDFLVISIYETYYEWAYAYPQEHPDKFEVVQVYFLDAQKQQPSLIIYKYEYN